MRLASVQQQGSLSKMSLNFAIVSDGRRTDFSPASMVLADGWISSSPKQSFL